MVGVDASHRPCHWDVTGLSGVEVGAGFKVAAAVLGSSGGSKVVGAACWLSMRGKGLLPELEIGGAASLLDETGLTAGAAPNVGAGCCVASFCLASGLRAW